MQLGRKGCANDYGLSEIFVFIILRWIVGMTIDMEISIYLHIKHYIMVQ